MLVFETHFDSCFHDSYLDSYILLFTSFVTVLQIKVLSLFFLGIFYIIALYVAILCLGYDAYLILSAVKSCHGKITVIPNNMEHYNSFAINDATFIDSYQFVLSSLDKLSSNLSKDQFRETRKCLESFYVQQPNQPQTNNVMEGGEQREVMHVHEDYQNDP